MTPPPPPPPGGGVCVCSHSVGGGVFQTVNSFSGKGSCQIYSTVWAGGRGVKEKYGSM